jgi:hypothetical protein
VRLFGHYVWYCNDTTPATVFDGMDVVGEAPVYGRGRGNDICGSAWTCPGEGTFGGDRLYEIYWELLPDLATIRIVVVAYFDDPGGLGLPPSYTLIGSLEVPYNAGNWASEGPWEISGFVGGPASAGACSTPWNGTFIIQRVTSCTIPDCPSLDCFPDCISNTQDCDGVTPWHSLLFIYINGTLHNLGYDESRPGYYLRVTISPEFGELEIDIHCEGDVQATSYTRLVGGVASGFYTEGDQLECVDGEVSISSEFTIADVDFTIVIFSNNNGLLP